MKFKLFLTDSDAMEYINSNYPGATTKRTIADYSECEDYTRDTLNCEWCGETPAMYVLDDECNEVDKVAYLEPCEPDAYRVVVGDDITYFDCEHRALMAFEEVVDEEHSEEEPRKIKLVYSIFNRFTGEQETEIIDEAY